MNVIGVNGLKKIFRCIKNAVILANVTNNADIRINKLYTNGENGVEIDYVVSNGMRRVFLRNDGESLWILFSDVTGTGFNDKRPFRLQFSTGECTISGICSRAYQDAAGNDIDIKGITAAITELQKGVNLCRSHLGI